MHHELKPGLKAEYTLDKVNQSHTAKTIGSGALDVLATPALAALLEKSACLAIDHLLDEGLTSVGTYLEMNHMAATPIGVSVKVTAELIQVDGRTFIFQLTAYDAHELIGSGIHHRVLVNRERFQDKIEKKRLFD